jgi:CheY-like chemotaxis protein
VGRVLVVDDEAALCTVLRRTLSDEFEVVVTTDARVALARLLSGERFDVVLCDVTMPSMDGIEFYEALAATNGAEANRIVFMTGGTLTPREDAFFAHASNLLLEKPFELEGLRALIERRMEGPASALAVQAVQAKAGTDS